MMHKEEQPEQVVDCKDEIPLSELSKFTDASLVAPNQERYLVPSKNCETCLNTATAFPVIIHFESSFEFMTPPTSWFCYIRSFQSIICSFILILDQTSDQTCCA